MKKKKLPFVMIIAALGIAVIVVVCNLLGINLFATLSGEANGKPTSFSSVSELESGKAYVWHHKDGDILKDMETTTEKPVYFTCIKGDYNFKKHELEEAVEHPRSIWISSDEDEKIPTVTSSDKLIYVSTTEVPDGVVFERFADYGYSIGVSNLIKDGGGHYYIDFASVEQDDYKYSIDMNSDAGQLAELTPVSRLYLDKVGKENVAEDNVSDGGSVLDLKKDKSYVCEFYTGTFYQDFVLRANIHTFSSLERFISYDYEFMHSNFIVIEIPEYFKSGYYFVNGVGLIRYVADSDASKYNNEAYDPGIDWNDPIIKYNENGEVIENPSNPDFVKPDYVQENSDTGVPDEELKKGDEGKDDE